VVFASEPRVLLVTTGVGGGVIFVLLVTLTADTAALVVLTFTGAAEIFTFAAALTLATLVVLELTLTCVLGGGFGTILTVACVLVTADETLVILGACSLTTADCMCRVFKLGFASGLMAQVAAIFLPRANPAAIVSGKVFSTLETCKATVALYTNYT